MLFKNGDGEKWRIHDKAKNGAPRARVVAHKSAGDHVLPCVELVVTLGEEDLFVIRVGKELNGRRGYDANTVEAVATPQAQNAILARQIHETAPDTRVPERCAARREALDLIGRGEKKMRI